MNDPNARQPSENEPKSRSGSEEQGVKRYHAEQTRSPRRPPPVNLAILIGIVALIVFLFYQFLFTRPAILSSRGFDASHVVEQIEGLSVVRSHFRYAVVVREESGDLVVRELANVDGASGIENADPISFKDPTLIVELHAVGTFGVRLDNIADMLEESGDTVFATLPKSSLLEVNVVDADTRILARIKGPLESPDSVLMRTASRRGETFAEEFAHADSASFDLADQHARQVLSLLIEQAGKVPLVRTAGDS